MMTIVLLSFFIKSVISDRGFVHDVHMNTKFKCVETFKELFTVKSEIQCYHRCLRRSCSRLNYNMKNKEKENCEVFSKVGDCSVISDQDGWKAAIFKVEVHLRAVHLDIIIASYGKGDPGFGNSNHSISINGIATAPSYRGFNVVVISPSNGYTLGVGNFDTYGELNASTAMISFISKYPSGSIVCIAVTDSASASSYYHQSGAYEWRITSQAAIDYLASLGSINASNIQWRTSFALLTAKGVPKPAWFAEKYAVDGRGPSIIKSSLRL